MLSIKVNRTLRYLYARTRGRPRLLVDVINDPRKRHNVVDDPASQAPLQRMDLRLAEVMRESECRNRTPTRI